MRKTSFVDWIKGRWTRNHRFLGLLTVVSVLLLAACQSATEETQEPTVAPGVEPTVAQPTDAPAMDEPMPAADQSVDLVGTPWVLVMYGEAASPTVVEAGTVVSAVFAADGSLAGSGGCNNYNTTYQVDGDQLTVNGPIASTLMACEAGMDQEMVYLDALQKAQNYSITEKGVLEIGYEGGVLFYIPQRVPLEGTLWKLTSMGPEGNPQTPVAGANFSAVFERTPGAPTGFVSGATGCNEYGTAYFAGLTELKVNLPAATGNTDCAAGLAEQESEFFKALYAARNYRILGDRLQITYDGNLLNFAVATAETPVEPGVGDLTPLNGTKWWYVSSDTQIIIPGTEITAEFAINEDGTSGTMSGFAGCNNYSTEIIGSFQLGGQIVTNVFCENPTGTMDQEAAYLTALESANGITYTSEELRISTASGTLIYTSAPPVEPLPPTEPTPEATQPIAPTPGEPSETPSGGPSAIIIGPTEGQVAQPLTFDASGSTSGTAIAQYLWDLGDGTTGQGISIEHAYAAPGEYIVLLTVVDNNGQSAQASILVTIQ